MGKLTHNGILISFEGTEGAGKSTLIQKLGPLLTGQGFQVTLTREPGGSPLAEKIRALVLDTTMSARTELLLYEAARAEHMAQKILPALEQGHVILCDRFTDSTLAYQAYARGLPWKEVKTLNQIATSGLEPDLTVLLDIDPETGLKRALNPNRFEAEGISFQKKVRAGFLKARSENPKRWLTLSVAKYSADELAGLLAKKISSRFKKRKLK